jgi:uracil-DNA glycosylase
MATYHPAYLLRNPMEKRKVWDDMLLIRDYLTSLQNSNR